MKCLNDLIKQKEKDRPIHVTYNINDTLSLIIYAHTTGEDTFCGDVKSYIPVHQASEPPVQSFPTKTDVACLLRRCVVNDKRINLHNNDEGLQGLYHAHYFTLNEWNVFCKHLPSYYKEIKYIHEEIRKGDPPMVNLDKFHVLSEDKQIAMILGSTQKPLVPSIRKRKQKRICHLPNRWIIYLAQCSMREDKQVTGIWSETDLQLEECEMKEILQRFFPIQEYLNLGKSSEDKLSVFVIPPEVD